MLGRGIDAGLGCRFGMLCGFGIPGSSGVCNSALDIFADFAGSLLAISLYRTIYVIQDLTF